MKKRFLPLVLGLAVITGMMAAFAMGDADCAVPDEPTDAVVLGEVDLAERMEIMRNQYRRMTPGKVPLVQDVGSWPAAWEEFGPAWNSSPATRDFATWLVPMATDRDGGETVLRDGHGTELWRGTTDFSKEESANVTLTGALIDEEDWPLWVAAREEIASRLEAPLHVRCGLYTNGLRFTNIWAATNGDFRLDFAWESNGEVQVFCRAMHTTSWVETVVWTNDENEIVTNDFPHWRQVDGEAFHGTADTWELRGVSTVTNGGGSFTDTNIPPDYDRVRFYAMAALVDTDNDGLTDGEEWLISHTHGENADSDGDGIEDGEEVLVRTDPMNPDVDSPGFIGASQILWCGPGAWVP
ncbi:MAG: hypothetical protein IK066_10455 [Kiritimatiellae bacterium]|nr:hypothetical protein [Kiritimatiellia bacterium]